MYSTVISPPQLREEPGLLDLINIAVVIVSARRRSGGKLRVDLIPLGGLLDDRLDRAGGDGWVFYVDVEGEAVALIEDFGFRLPRVLGEHALGIFFVSEHSARAFHGRFDHGDDDLAVLGAEGAAGDQTVDQKFKVQFAKIFRADEFAIAIFHQPKCVGRRSDDTVDQALR